MKKVYQKPEIEFENFRLDVEIASRNPVYDAAVQTFIDIYGREPSNEAEFQEFIKQHSALDPNDGWCYFTAYIPS